MRSHVFPVCGTGSKTFVSKDKIEGGLSSTTGTLKATETSDLDTISIEYVSGVNEGKFYGNYFYLDLISNSEFILDLSSPPETALPLTTSTLWFMIIPWAYGTNTSTHPHPTWDVKIWSDINDTDYYGSIPQAGSVVCIAIKSSRDAAWINTSFWSTVIWDEKYNERFGPELQYDDNRSRGLFENKVFFGPLDNFNLESGMWLTFMFTGTRFVLLGSNNWTL